MTNFDSIWQEFRYFRKQLNYHMEGKRRSKNGLRGKIISLALVPRWKKNQHWILIDDKFRCNLTRFLVNLIFRTYLAKFLGIGSLKRHSILIGSMDRWKFWCDLTRLCVRFRKYLDYCGDKLDLWIFINENCKVACE